jgi:hypothetical protein
VIAAVGAVAASLALAVQPAEAATATATTLVTASNPVRVATDVTYTAVVTVPGQPGTKVDTGTVAFTATGLSTCPSQPVSGGVATCTTEWIGTTTRSVTATYSGDATWAGSASAVLSQRVSAEGNLFTVNPTLDQTCGTFHDLALPNVPGATRATITARGGAGGVSGTNTNGTPAPGQGNITHVDGIPYPVAGSSYLAYQVGCGGGSATAGQGSPANGGAGWGDGGSGGTPGSTGPRGGGGGGGTAACLSTAVNHMCESGIPVLVAGGGGGTGPGVNYGGGGGGAGGGAPGGAKGGGCGDTPPTAGSSGSSWSGPMPRWYGIASKPLGFTVGGAGGGGAGCGSNKGGAGGGGGGGTGGAGGDRCCTASSGGIGGTTQAPGGGGAGETGNGSAGATPNATFGGNGGNGANSTGTGATGGGGGGGYTGGGGGGAGNPAGSAGGPGGGGGGGSSWYQLLGTSSGNRVGSGQAPGEAGSLALKLTGPVVTVGSLGSPNVPVDTAVSGLQLPFTANHPVTPGTFSYAITAQHLPPGTSIDPATGAVTGTPTAPGTFPAIYTVTGTHTVQGAFSVTVVEPWTVTGTATTTTSTSTTTSTTPTTTTSTTTPTTSTTTPTTSTSTSTSTSTTTTPPCSADLTPFPSPTAAVTQLAADAGKTTTIASTKAALVAGVANCTIDVDDLAVQFVQDPQTLDDARLVRLYLAYFKRPPDPDGFAYWQRQLDNGKGLINAAKKFAESSEFTTKYGSVSNANFVELVYQNVLGRSSDAAGKTFWLTRLDNKTKNRGDVMINFSESSENVTKKTEHVAVFRLYRAMLRKFPNKAAYEALLNPVLADTSTLADAAHALRTSAAYAARF